MATSFGQTVLVLLLAMPMVAGAGNLDLRVALASEEAFRGVVQNNSPAASARADVRFANRAYVGARALNNRSAGDAEVDAWAGISGTVLLADLLPMDLDGGLTARAYTGDRRGPERRDLDWLEAYASAGVGPLRGGIAHAPDYFGTGAAAWRLSGQLRWPLAAGTDLTAIAGWNEGAGIGRHLARRGGDARYADYSVVLQQTLGAGWSVQAEATGASIRLDDRRRPRFLVALRWRWGRQFPVSTGR